MLGRKSTIVKGVLVLAVVLGLMIPASMVLSSQDAPETEFVRVKIDSTSQLDALKERGAHLIADYGNGYVLAKVTDGEAAYLEKYTHVERMNDVSTIGIYNSGVVIDTKAAVPPVHKSLMSKATGDEYIVQFSGPIAKEWIESIKAMGGSFHQNYEHYSYLVKISSSKVSELRSLPFVNWVGTYHPAYKVSEGLMDGEGSKLIGVRAYEGTDIVALVTALDSIGATVLTSSSDSQNVILSADTSLMPDIAALPEVMTVYPESMKETMDRIAGEIHKFHYAWYPTWSGLPAPPTAGPTSTALTGRLPGSDGILYNANDEYEIAGIVDSGWDWRDPNGGHVDFFNSPNGDRIVDYYMATIWAQNNPDGWGFECEPHGTACAGIIAQDGYAWETSPHEGVQSTTDKEWHLSEAGVAPESKLTIAGVPGNFGQGILGWLSYTGTACSGKPCWDRMYEDDGARTLSNSWGGTGGYNGELDRRIDEWNDLMILFAAGNDGPQLNTISESFAKNKNGLVIGASQNYRPERFGADNHNIMASYSSRGGPLVGMVGGRILPNLVAIGTEGAAAMGPGGYLCNRDNAAFGQGVPQPDYIMEVDEYDYDETLNNYLGHDGINDYRYFGGTSQATPMAAGTYMLVREYLREVEGFSYVNSSLAKAFLINGAVRMSEELYEYPGWDQGWGRINVKESLFPTPPRTNQYVEGQFNDTTTCDIASGTCLDPANGTVVGTINTNVVASDVPLKATLVWIDSGFGEALDRNLNLRLVSPSGVEYRGNAYNSSGQFKGWSAPNPETAGVDNTKWLNYWVGLSGYDDTHTVEQVEVKVPETGVWALEVISESAGIGQANFSVVFSANIGPQVPFKIDLSSNYPPALSLPLLGTASYPFTVSNFGQNSDTVTLTTTPPELYVSYYPTSWSSGVVLNSLESESGLAIIEADDPSLTPGIYKLRITGISNGDPTVQDFLEITVEILDSPLPSPIQITTETTNDVDPSVLVFDNGIDKHIFIAYIKTVPIVGDFGGENVWMAHTTLDSAGQPIEPWNYTEIADLNEFPNDPRFNYIPSGTYAGRVILTWTGYNPIWGDQQMDRGSWGRLVYSDPPYTTWTFGTNQMTLLDYIDENSGQQSTNSKRVSFTLFRESTEELMYVYEYLGSASSEDPPTMAGTYYAVSTDGGETWPQAQQLFPPLGSPPNLFYFFPTGCVDQNDKIWVFAYYRTGGTNDRDLRVAIYDGLGWTQAPPLIWDTTDNVQFPACMSTAEGPAGNRVYFSVTRDLGTAAFKIFLSWTDGDYASNTPPAERQLPETFSRSFSPIGDGNGRSGPGPLGGYTVSLSDANYNRGPLMVLMNTTDPCGSKTWITYMENTHLEVPPYPANPFGTPNIWTLHSCDEFATQPDLIRVTADAFAKGHRMADTLQIAGQGVVYETYHSNKGGLEAVDYNVYLTIYTQDWDTKPDLLGPTASMVNAIPNPFDVSTDTEFYLTANLNDIATGMHNISEAQYTMTSTSTDPNDVDWGLSLPMAITGSTPAEVAYAMVQPVAWQPSEVHRLCVRGRDDAPAQNWGRGACTDVYVVGPAGAPPGAPMLTSVAIQGLDVNMTWTLSADDGGPGFDGYEVYVSSIYNTGLLGYQLLSPLLPPGTDFYVHPGVGTNTNSYFYTVVAKNASGSRSASPVQGAKMAYHYTPGVHLISLPLALSTTDLPTILSGLDYDIAWWYDPTDVADHWKSYSPSKTVNDLFFYDRTMGLWIEVNTDDDLIFAGLVPSGTSINLEVGWNLIGYPSFAYSTVADVFSSVVYDRMEGFDPTNPPQNLRLMTDSGTMTPGYGYWIKVSMAGPIII